MKKTSLFLLSVFVISSGFAMVPGRVHKIRLIQELLQQIEEMGFESLNVHEQRKARRYFSRIVERSKINAQECKARSESECNDDLLPLRDKLVFTPSFALELESLDVRGNIERIAPVKTLLTPVAKFAAASNFSAVVEGVVDSKKRSEFGQLYGMSGLPVVDEQSYSVTRKSTPIGRNITQSSMYSYELWELQNIFNLKMSALRCQEVAESALSVSDES